MNRKRLSRLGVLVAVCALYLVACGPVSETTVVEAPVKEPTEATVEAPPAAAEVTAEAAASATVEPETPAAGLDGLWYPLEDEPASLDIQLGDHLIIDQCIEGLFEYRGDGSIEPTGATGFEVSDDGRVYTVKLREEAVWSDGERVTAQHFVDGIIRLVDPEVGSYYAASLFDVEGAEAFFTGESGDPATVGVRAVDDLTLEIRLEEPAAYFEVLLPTAFFYPVRLDLIKEYGDQWTEPGNYLSNGPYLLDAWDHGRKVVLVKNPGYWNAGEVEIEKITLPVIQDYADTMSAYENDELHSTGALTAPEYAPRILADPILSQELHVLPRPGVYYVGLNTLRPPTDDVRVRKALALAFDRIPFLESEATWPGLAPLSCTTPPLIMGHQPYGQCGYAYDPEQARALLAEAGYPDGEGFPTLELWTHWRPFREATAQALADAWEENLGITTEVHLPDWDLYNDFLDECNKSKEALAACNMNVYIQGWVMDHGDPQNQLEVLFAPYSAIQCTGWQSERYEELLDQARIEPDTDARAELYQEADRILCEKEVAVIPIMSWQWVVLVKEGVTFEYPPVFGSPPFEHWALP